LLWLPAREMMAIRGQQLGLEKKTLFSAPLPLALISPMKHVKKRVMGMMLMLISKRNSYEEG